MTQPRRSASARRAGLRSAASRTPEERSASATRASNARWARWRAERGIEAPASTTENRLPADGLNAFLDEVLREQPSWSFAQARREAAIRQRKASAELAWEALRHAKDADAPRPAAAPEWDEDDA